MSHDLISFSIVFRSISLIGVTRQVFLDEIGCLSRVTRRVVGFEKPLEKKSEVTYW